MKIIAHRGASHEAPENTLAAVRLAWEQNADGVEVDVHLSKDAQIMVIHDPTTRRTARRKGLVNQLTAAELQTLDVGRWKSPRWAGEPIPTLEEVIDTVPDGKELLIEFKCGPEVIGPFEQLVCNVGIRSLQLIAIGFDLHTMRLMKKRMPNLRAFWVASLDRRRDWSRPNGPLDRFIGQAQDAGMDGVDLDARGPITAALARRIHDAGLELYVWTVDSLKQARRLAEAGVDGLATNKCGMMRGQVLTKS